MEMLLIGILLLVITILISKKDFREKVTKKTTNYFKISKTTAKKTIILAIILFALSFLVKVSGSTDIFLGDIRLGFIFLAPNIAIFSIPILLLFSLIIIKTEERLMRHIQK